MNSLKQIASWIAVLALLPLIGACASKGPEMKTVEYVDLERFMGDWYVIANIPTFLEKGAHNAVESYALNEDGTIATTFVFRADSFDGEEKRYHPKGFVRDTGSNAEWGMRFIWPIKADYRIVYLDENYTQTVIARQKRDFVWIMAREPNISDEEYDKLVDFVESIGYDISKIERVPQRWNGDD
ncbi:MAG: lipocalin family protein [Gammaproteobacteria bacterium]|nr:lipocalin family protein [Gammaproteobacteria bacterium]